jgi:hybrid cluster-associated redox disulfide protein
MTCGTITEDMNIKEVIEKHPEVIPVFAKYNMGCIGCIAASFEKISDIAAVHGIDVKEFVKELNEAMKNN